jgi:spore coat polysaccharide biosynthesis protein SpsF (cytidylyltransferase family)
MKITAIVQARMGSTRLPGKVLMDLGGLPALSRVIRRLQRATLVNEVAVATTVSAKDDDIVNACNELGVRCFRGSEQDVLNRYLRAAKKFQADAIVRITSDCPLIDPQLVDDVIRVFMDQHADYACNVIPRTYPRGLDAEVFSNSALTKASEIADQPYQREHVTPLLYERRDLFRVASTRGEKDFSRHRWTLDTPEDLRLIREIYSALANRDDFGWREALEVVERSPELAGLNAHVRQKLVRESAVLS